MLVKQSLGKFLPIAGNVAVFCQNESDYKKLTSLQKKLVKQTANPKQKYYPLREPIVIPATSDIPKAVYKHLYIRKPDPSPFGQYLGDIDFVMEAKKYSAFKKLVKQGKVNGAKIFDRPGWDTVQITNPEIDSVAFVSTKEFAEKIRKRF